MDHLESPFKHAGRLIKGYRTVVIGKAGETSGSGRWFLGTPTCFGDLGAGKGETRSCEAITATDLRKLPECRSSCGGLRTTRAEFGTASFRNRTEAGHRLEMKISTTLTSAAHKVRPNKLQWESRQCTNVWV